MTAKTGYAKGITLQKAVEQGVYGLLSYAIFVFGSVPETHTVPSMVCLMAICRALHNYLKHRNA